MIRVLVCEKQDDWGQSLTSKLCRLFSVRLIDELSGVARQSIQPSSGSNGSQLPLLHVVIDFDRMPNTIDDLKGCLSNLRHTGGAKIIFSEKFDQKTELSGRNDEYFLKPIVNPEELRVIVSHIIAEFQQPQPNPNLKYNYRSMEFCFDALQLRLVPDNSTQSLPPKEARLLKAFLESPEKVWSRAELTQRLWGQTKVSPRSLDSHVSRLRKRLAPAEIEIESKYGGGYCLR